MSRRFWSGPRAREARKAAGLTPDAVADHVGAHRASVYGWEAGREPQMRHAVALADLYGVGLDSFFIHGGNGDTSPDPGGKPHEPGTAAVEGSAGLARTGA